MTGRKRFRVGLLASKVKVFAAAAAAELVSGRRFTQEMMDRSIPPIPPAERPTARGSELFIKRLLHVTGERRPKQNKEEGAACGLFVYDIALIFYAISMHVRRKVRAGRVRGWDHACPLKVTAATRPGSLRSGPPRRQQPIGPRICKPTCL